MAQQMSHALHRIEGLTLVKVVNQLGKQDTFVLVCEMVLLNA